MHRCNMKLKNLRGVLLICIVGSVGILYFDLFGGAAYFAIAVLILIILISNLEV